MFLANTELKVHFKLNNTMSFVSLQGELLFLWFIMKNFPTVKKKGKKKVSNPFSVPGLLCTFNMNVYYPATSKEICLVTELGLLTLSWLKSFSFPTAMAKSCFQI